ncbi:MAG: orotate phosphoribosyltransferase [Desulfocapsaceae bacterium]|nr:orotate phosphoribosyltransferase [Desulfocapsaceae bacterium]
MARLIQELIDSGAVKFGDFTLASGKKSKYYVDIKQAVGDPKRLAFIANEIWIKILSEDIRFDVIACVELGGVPIGVMVSQISECPLIIIRKEAKDHGVKNRIVGKINKGMKVLLVEDVTTTGGTAINAIKILKEAGMRITDVISVVDREDGAEDAFRNIGVRLYSLIKAQELLKDDII